MEKLAVFFEHTYLASQTFSSYANWNPFNWLRGEGSKPVRGSSSATLCSSDSQQDETCDSSSSLRTWTYSRPDFDTGTGERVHGPRLRSLEDNATWRKVFPLGAPASMTVRECTPPPPPPTLARLAQFNYRGYYRDSPRATMHTQTL